MASVFLRPRALHDLEVIWNYTFDTWGEEQANQYILDLNDGFESLVIHPEKGRACDDIREGYRKYDIGKHIAFYRQTAKGIEVIRVLHQRMDPERHL